MAERTRNDPMFQNLAMNSHALIRWTLQNQALQYEPGTHYAYSNFGYCILGRVIEKVGGETYAEFVEQNVLARCDVSDMRIGATLFSIPRRVKLCITDRTASRPTA